MPINNTANADGSFTGSAQGANLMPQSFNAAGSASMASNQNAGTGTSYLPTINSTTLTPQSPLNIPPAPPINNGAATNASIPSPAAIINQDIQPTQAGTQQSQLLNQIASITGNQKSLATQQTTAENAAGIPGMAASVKSLSTRLQGLSDQATLLGNNAMPGGTIDNTEQQNVLNQGNITTSAGMGAIRSADLRNNQIQQASIAAQSLSVKSALLAAQGDYSNAKDAADKAAQVAFDAQTQQINGYKAQLDAIAPTLNKEQTARADLIKAQLDDRTNQIQLQRENFKTGQGAIMDAMKNNPNNTAAQFAAHQALSLNPNDPQYLQKVQELVSKYSTDLSARALDQQLKAAQIQNLAQGKQDTLEQQYRTALEKAFSTRSGSLGIQSQKVDQAIHLRTLLDQYKGADGTYSVPPAQYAELAQGMASLLSGNNTLSDSRVADIQQQSAKGDLGKLMTYITGTNYSGSTNSILKNLSDSIDRQGQVAQQLRDQYMKGLQGLKPTRLDPTRANAITQEYMPSYTDALKGSYNVGGSNSTQNTGQTISAGGKSFTVGQVYQDATGAKWTVDAQGNWSKQ